MPGLYCTHCKRKIESRPRRGRSNRARYCSQDCFSRDTLYAGLQEPQNREQAQLFLKTIAERKREVTTPEEKLVRDQTPYDDSPEAERQMREAICPNPPAYIYASTGTPNGKGV